MTTNNINTDRVFSIRPAKPEEAGLVLEFIKKLAVYEKCADEVVADEATVYHSLFVERSAEVVFAEEDGVVVGFALFFHNFSTFVGRKGLYLEDLFILPEKRGKGYSKALLKHLAKIAVERNCGRMEWICLDWNEPALKVYRSIGAVPMDEWTVQRLEHLAADAALRLKTTTYTIAQIADDLRIPDASTFSKFFKRMRGCSPKEFRKGT